jgi:RHS repeat-associated protein
MKVFILRFTSLIILLLSNLLLSSQANAQSDIDESFEVVEDASGNLYLENLHAEDQFVLIHSEVTVPILVKAPRIVYALEQVNGVSNVRLLTDTEYQNLNLVESNYQIVYEDLNADGILEQIVKTDNPTQARYVIGGSTLGGANLNVLPINVATPSAPSIVPVNSLIEDTLSTTVGVLNGEFRVDESGAATYSVPIDLPKGIGGIAPQLGVGYSSSGGNGVMGMGWNISGLSGISRCRQTLEQDAASKPITLTNTDRFCLDGQKLVAVNGAYGDNNTQYRTEVDSMVRVTSMGISGNGPAYFMVERTDGSVSHYGYTNDSVIQDDNGTVLNWGLNQTQDNIGNTINFVYDKNSFGENELLIEKVQYSGHTVTFNYNTNAALGDREDVSYGYMHGVMVEQTARLDSIDIDFYDGASQVYNLGYQGQQDTALTQLISVQKCADDICLPETTFDWFTPAPSYKYYSEIEALTPSGREGLAGAIPADVDGDGVSDLVYLTTTDGLRYHINVSMNERPASNMFNTGKRIHSFSTEHERDNPEFKAADVDGDGQIEIVFLDSTEWKYYDFNSTTTEVRPINTWGYGPSEWAFPVRVFSLADITKTYLSKAQDLFFYDVDGDALVDIMYKRYLNKHTGGMTVHHNMGLHEDGYTNWEASKTVTLVGMPERELTPLDGEVSSRLEHLKLSPNSGAYDFNSDGVSDLLLTSGEVYSEEEDCSTYYDSDQTIEDCNHNERRVVFLLAFVFVDGEYQYYSDIGPINAEDSQSFDKSVVISDFNGDGYSDVLFKNRELYGSKVFWNISYGNGFGFAPPSDIEFGDSEDVFIFEPKAADFNNDGRVDLAYFYKGDKTWYVSYQHNDGNFSNKIRLFGPITNYSSKFKDRDTTFLSEWEGNGTIDFTYLDVSTQTIHMYADRRNQGSRANQIRQVTNGFGLKTRITYKRLTDPNVYTKGRDAAMMKNYGKGSPVFDLISPAHVVSKVTSDAPSYDNTNDTLSVEYTYEGMRAQSGGRGMLGFEKISTFDPITNITTETVYNQAFPYTGMPKETRRYLGKYLNWETVPDNQKLSFSRNWYLSEQLNDNATIYPYLHRSLERQYSLHDDGSSTSPISVVDTTQTYEVVADNHANLTRVVVETKDANDNLVGSVITSNLYEEDNLNEWWLGRITQSEVTHQRPNVDDITRVANFEYYPVGSSHAGMLKTEHVEHGQGINQALSTLHCYNSVGAPLGKVTYSQNYSPTNCSTAAPSAPENNINHVYRQTINTYDSEQRYLISSSNGLFDSSTVNRRNAYGQITQSTDINGVVSYVAYDSFGRQFASANQAGAFTQTQRRLSENIWPSAPPISESFYFVERTETAGKPTTYGYFDVAGRQVAAVKQGFEADEWIYQYTRYDKYGRAVQQSVPSKSNTPSHWNITMYDVFGRPQEVDSADGTHNTINYEGLTTTTRVDVIGGAHSNFSQSNIEQKNVLGEVVRVIDNNDGETRYAYDATGNLTSVTGVDNVSVITHFDKLGRKTAMQDPNKGNWTYTYNALGELISQTTSRGFTTEYYRDSIGRTKKRKVLYGNAVNEITAYQFEQHQLKRECQIGSDGNCANDLPQKHFSYDALGRVERVSTGLDGQLYTQSTEYDEYGRIFQQFDASGDANGIRYYYNPQGYAYKQVEARNSLDADAKVYHQVIEMDAFGNVTQFQQNDSKITTHRAYDPITGYATGINVSNGRLIQSNTYEFDAIGNLRLRTRDSINSNYAHQSELFDYDELNRLTTINDVERVQYYANGNIKWKSDVNNGAASYYCYRSSRPHAVSGLGSQGCTTNDYQYDASGNMTQGKGRSISYAHYDKPVFIQNAAGTTRFAYDNSRNRYKRETTENGITTKTLYIGNVELIYKAGAFSEMKRYLPDAIQTRYASTYAVQTRYLHKDHLGSINTITNEQGKIIEKLYFDAWGKRQSIDKAFWLHAVQNEAALTLTSILNITTRGYTGHEHIDHADIIHMNGRIYDPTLGRFLQADPHIQAPKNSQSYNRYSYVLNNPLSYTDPSGYFFSKVFKKIFRNVIRAAAKIIGPELTNVIGNIIFYKIGGPLGSAYWSYNFTRAMGGSSSQALRGAFTSAASAFALQGIGGSDYWGQAGSPQNILANATVGGIASELQGGKFGHGFLSAGVASAFKPLVNQIGGGSANYMPVRVIAAAIIGGTASRLSGGKFANGATTGAFVQLFNGETRLAAERQRLSAGMQRAIDILEKRDPSRPMTKEEYGAWCAVTGMTCGGDTLPKINRTLSLWPTSKVLPGACGVSGGIYCTAFSPGISHGLNGGSIIAFGTGVGAPLASILQLGSLLNAAADYCLCGGIDNGYMPKPSHVTSTIGTAVPGAPGAVISVVDSILVGTGN